MKQNQNRQLPAWLLDCLLSGPKLQPFSFISMWFRAFASLCWAERKNGQLRVLRSTPNHNLALLNFNSKFKFHQMSLLYSPSANAHAPLFLNASSIPIPTLTKPHFAPPPSHHLLYFSSIRNRSSFVLRFSSLSGT